MNTRTLSSCVVLALAAALPAQLVPVPLNYNFNGIVHAGEAGLPDSPTGYRSISDRGLDFSAGVPNDPLLANYQFVTAADTLDIVHVGNRNTVDNGGWAFDTVVNGDFRGVQPAWLANPDQTGPQATVLVTPLPIVPGTEVAFLFQVSNGGGSFDVTFTFQAGGSYTATLGSGDWFGGAYPGTDNVDLGTPGNNLSITEGRVPMSSFSGQVVTQIEFGNRSNTNAGYAILACNFEYSPQPRRINKIPLAYNWNGIVHAGEAGQADAANGYRSISDRGLNFAAGVPAQTLLAPYAIVAQPGVLDLVHLGNRNTVSGGFWAFDLVADGDQIGTQPTWLPNPDHTGPQTTTLTDRILLDPSSKASLLFQISNGGGSFDVEFVFLSGAPAVYTVSGGDWFGGSLPGTAGIDAATAGANLSLTERTIDLSAHAGRVVTDIRFQNATTLSGYAIVAMNVGGCIHCANGAPAVIAPLAGGTQGTMVTSSSGGLGAPLNYTLTGAAPVSAGLWNFSAGSINVPLALVLPGCPGAIRAAGDVLLGVITDSIGSASIDIPMPVNQSLCGATITGQFAGLATGNCWLVMSDGLAITIGN